MTDDRVERFKAAWFKCKNLKEVGEIMNMTARSVSTTAWQLRSLGHDLPYKLVQPFADDPEFARRAGKLSGEAKRKK